jgi:UPF0716 protein FxsA
MRRRVPWWLLALLFIVVPVVEIFVLIQIGQVIGAWWTILLLVADGLLGSWLMKREGTRAMRALQQALDARRMPARELADGALILVGGTLLLTPGFVTDIAGLVCVLPFTRPLVRGALVRFLTRRFMAGPGATAAGLFDPAGPGATRTRQRPGPDGVVQGEVID